MRKIIIGTNHFGSLQSAINYYHAYGLTAKDVRERIESGAINVTERPTLKPGEQLLFNHAEGRYFIESEI